MIGLQHSSDNHVSGSSAVPFSSLGMRNADASGTPCACRGLSSLEPTVCTPSDALSSRLLTVASASSWHRVDSDNGVIARGVNAPSAPLAPDSIAAEHPVSSPSALPLAPLAPVSHGAARRLPCRLGVEEDCADSVRNLSPQIEVQRDVSYRNDWMIRSRSCTCYA